MVAISAGVLLYRFRDKAIEVLLIHPGGPFWRNRDAGAWMIPKGAIEAGETGRSIDFELEWPPKSGRMKRFPETDAARWMGLDEARRLILPSQRPILDALDQRLR